MVDYEGELVVLHHWEKAREVVAAKVEEEALESEGGDCVQEVEGHEAGEVAACGL